MREGHHMVTRNFMRAKLNGIRLLAVAVVVCTGIGVAQNNCALVPPAGTCPAPASPLESWWAGNSTKSTCPGGTSWVGFTTTTPAPGSWSGQFEGLDAASISAAGSIPRSQPDANGAVGPTNTSGIGQ